MAMSAVAPSSLRLFLGLWPPPGTLAELQANAAMWQGSAAARRSPPERWHITLHFLGEVAAERLPALREGLQARWQGCELALDRAQVWPGGIAVLEAQDVPPALEQLHRTLGAQLQALGLPVEARRYRPHVTLARKAFGSRPPAGFAPLHWPAEAGFVLAQSLPGGRGYLPLQRFG
jgi:2'-5' RNA ligase